MILTSNPGNLFERSKGDLGFSTNASEYQGNSAKIVEYKRLSGVPAFLFSMAGSEIDKSLKDGTKV
jgi:hypothetical protein